MKILDLVFPRFCLNCGKGHEYVCEHCFGQLRMVDVQRCPGCRRPSDAGKFCSGRCYKGHYFEHLLVCLEYDQRSFLRKLVTRYKYRFVEDLAFLFAGLMAELIDPILTSRTNFLISHVPSTKQRLKFRGFDHVGILAELLGESLEVEVCNCLKKVRETAKQSELGREERMHNLKDTFEVPFSLEGRNVILIDDVATTCSTLNECAKALKAAGAAGVVGLVLARGRLDSLQSQYENWY